MRLIVGDLVLKPGVLGVPGVRGVAGLVGVLGVEVMTGQILKRPSKQMRILDNGRGIKAKNADVKVQVQVDIGQAN